MRAAFAELNRTLMEAASTCNTPCRRLHALCYAYLRFADARPQLYRAMFGLWRTQAPEDGLVVDGELVLLGSDCLHLLAETLDECVAAGISGSRDPAGDAVALWLGLHGLADQRSINTVPLGPPNLADRLIAVLAHLQSAELT